MKLIDYTVHNRGFDETFITPSFNTKDEANSKIHEIDEYLYSHIYFLNHGEYARPSFKAQRYKDGWGIKVFWHYCYGTCHAPTNGRFMSNNRFFDNFFGDEKKTVNESNRG